LRSGNGEPKPTPPTPNFARVLRPIENVLQLDENWMKDKEPKTFSNRLRKVIFEKYYAHRTWFPGNPIVTDFILL